MVNVIYHASKKANTTFLCFVCSLFESAQYAYLKMALLFILDPSKAFRTVLTTLNFCLDYKHWSSKTWPWNGLKAIFRNACSTSESAPRLPSLLMIVHGVLQGSAKHPCIQICRWWAPLSMRPGSITVEHSTQNTQTLFQHHTFLKRLI